MKNALTMFVAVCGVLILSGQAQAQYYGSNSGDFLVQFLVGATIVFVVFLLLRELNCWYWKINRGIELLEDIQKLLKQNQAMASQGQPAAAQPVIRKASVSPVPTQSKENAPQGKQVLIISEVACPSQAEQLGIEIGDIFLTYDGEKLATDKELGKLVSMAKYNKKKQVEINLLRGDSEVTVRASPSPLGITTSTEYI